MRDEVLVLQVDGQPQDRLLQRAGRSERRKVAYLRQQQPPRRLLVRQVLEHAYRVSGEQRQALFQRW